jgi:hypothetical protein
VHADPEKTEKCTPDKNQAKCERTPTTIQQHNNNTVPSPMYMRRPYESYGDRRDELPPLDEYDQWPRTAEQLILSAQPRHYSPTSPTYSPTSPKYPSSAEDELKLCLRDSEAMTVKIDCQVCNIAFNEFDGSCCRKPVAICTAGHMVCKTCVGRIAPRADKKCPLFGCDCTAPLPAVVANTAEQTLKFNELAYHTDRIVTRVSDVLKEKIMEEAEFEKQIAVQNQLIAKLESDKSILFGEYKKKCGEVELNKRRIEEAELFIEDKYKELDEMACSLGSVIHRFEVRSSRAEHENKKLKKDILSYAQSYEN